MGHYLEETKQFAAILSQLQYIFRPCVLPRMYLSLVFSSLATQLGPFRFAQSEFETIIRRQKYSAHGLKIVNTHHSRFPNLDNDWEFAVSHTKGLGLEF